MSDEENTNPAYLFRKAFKSGTETQADFLKRMASMQFETIQGFMNVLQTITNFNAIFKATVQSNGRISIPEAEREALGIQDGDLVQVIIVPLEKGKERRGKDDSQKFQTKEKGGGNIE
jgi:AbrB family looped-hinge helix DNA binding protein